MRKSRFLAAAVSVAAPLSWPSRPAVACTCVAAMPIRPLGRLGQRVAGLAFHPVPGGKAPITPRPFPESLAA